MKLALILLLAAAGLVGCAEQVPGGVKTQSASSEDVESFDSMPGYPGLPSSPTNQPIVNTGNTGFNGGTNVTPTAPAGGTQVTPSISNRDLVIKAYREILDRSDFELSHDEAGIRYWVARMDAGVSITAVRASMKASTEYFVRAQYKAILGRPIDLGGLYYYLYEIDSGRMTRSSFVNHLIYVCENRVNGEC